jgi:hypothetical protein
MEVTAAEALNQPHACHWGWSCCSFRPLVASNAGGAIVQFDTKTETKVQSKITERQVPQLKGDEEGGGLRLCKSNERVYNKEMAMFKERAGSRYSDHGGAIPWSQSGKLMKRMFTFVPSQPSQS